MQKSFSKFFLFHLQLLQQRHNLTFATIIIGRNYIPSIGVKEGLSCVLFHVIAARKTRNLALPSLQDSVYFLIVAHGAISDHAIGGRGVPPPRWQSYE